jgi:hypothetical protein
MSRGDIAEAKGTGQQRICKGYVLYGHVPVPGTETWPEGTREG